MPGKRPTTSAFVRSSTYSTALIFRPERLQCGNSENVSNQTRRRLLLISGALLVCVILATLAWRPAHSRALISTLKGYETNYGLVTANILVSNASSYAWNVTIREGGGMRLLYPGRSGTWAVQLGTPRPPRLQIVGTPSNDGTVSGQARRIFRGSEISTLDLSQ